VDKFESVVRDVQGSLEEFKAQHNKRLDAVERALDQREVNMKEHNTVSISANGYIPASAEEKTFSEYLRKGEQMDPYSRKTLVLANDTGAGYLAPDAYTTAVIEKLQEYSPVRSVAQIRQTDATAIQIPRQTGVVDGGWTTEIGLRVEDANLTFGLETITAHETYAFVKVGRQMLEDSRVNFDAFLAGEFGRKFASIEGLAFISGNTTGRPEGLLTNANIASANSGDGANLTSDGLIDLVYSLPSEYRKRAAWLMNRGTIQEVRKLRDGNNSTYIWQPSFQAGQPETLLGYPIYESCDMPDVANATYPVLFGDFRRSYIIVDRVSMDIQRLTERYAEYGIVAYMARKRVGGQVVLADAIKKMYIAT
jgi:HK97 family phage major capsid protein